MDLPLTMTDRSSWNLNINRCSEAKIIEFGNISLTFLLIILFEYFSFLFCILRKLIVAKPVVIIAWILFQHIEALYSHMYFMDVP